MGISEKTKDIGWVILIYGIHWFKELKEKTNET